MSENEAADEAHRPRRPAALAIRARDALVTSWMPLAGLAVVMLLVVVPSWPGRINADTYSMLQEIENGRLTDWHSPILMWLFTPFYEFGLGVGALFLGQVLLIYTSLYLVVSTYGRSRRWATLVTAAICLHPVTYGLLTAVIRDTWFLAFFMAALAVVSLRRWNPLVHLGLVFLLVYLMYGARQNALAVAPLFFFVELRALPWRPSRALGAGWRALGAVGLSAAVAVLVAGSLHLIDVSRIRPAEPQVSDLIRLSMRSGDQLLPDVANPNAVTVERMLEIASPYTVERLLFGCGFDCIAQWQTDEQMDAVRSAWWDALRDDPLEYVAMRWQLFSRQIGLSGNTRNPFLPADIYDPFGIHPAFPRLANRATDYQLTFNQGLEWSQAGAIHRTWPMVLLNGVAAVAALLKRRGSYLAVFLMASSLALLATVFGFAPQDEFRFVAPSIVMGLIAFAGLFVGWRPWPEVGGDDVGRTAGAGQLTPSVGVIESGIATHTGAATGPIRSESDSANISSD